MALYVPEATENLFSKNLERNWSIISETGPRAALQYAIISFSHNDFVTRHVGS